MKFIDNQIWLEVSDWEAVGVKYNTLKTRVSEARKAWACVITQGKGREMLFLYESLGPKHKALFAKAARKFLQEQEAKQANAELESLKEKILACVQTRPQDILVFQDKFGFAAEKTHKASLYARRAAWLRFLAETNTKTIKTKFAPLKNKAEFLNFCLPILHAENCFGFRNPNLQYLKIRLVNWNKHGLNSCIDARSGKQNALKVSESVEGILLGLLTSIKKPTIQELYEVYLSFLSGEVRLTNTETGEVYNPANFPRIGYITLYNIVSKLQNKALYTALHGTELSYRAAYDFYAKRKRPKHFGSMLTADDWDVNINVQIKFAGKLYKKVYAYLFFDVATRNCVGYAWGFEKTTDLFLRALRNTLANPCFQGKLPYELQAETHLVKAINEGVLKEFFVETTILPKNPMAKFAERDIESLKYEVFAKDLEYKDYFKGRHYNKREAWRLEKDQQKEVKTFTEATQIEVFLKKIVAAYNDLHPVATDLHPELLPQNPERLAFHLGERVETSYRNGRIQAKNKEWAFTELEKLRHKEVEVRFWQNEAYVYQDGVFLGKAEELQAAQASKLEANEEDGKIKGKQLQIQKKIRGKIAEQAQKAEPLAIDKVFERSCKEVCKTQDTQEHTTNANKIDIFLAIGEKILAEEKKKTA
ncbi:MAG: hypothetical protein Fur0027_14340 [Raineya sp.]